MSPAKLAETALAYVPALMPLRLTPERVATPFEFVVAVGLRGVPLRLKVIVLFATPVPPDVRVAVSVAVPPYVPAPLTPSTAVAACEFTVWTRVVLLRLKVAVPPYSALIV